MNRDADFTLATYKVTNEPLRALKESMKDFVEFRQPKREVFVAFSAAETRSIQWPFWWSKMDIFVAISAAEL